GRWPRREAHNREFRRSWGAAAEPYTARYRMKLIDTGLPGAWEVEARLIGGGGGGTFERYRRRPCRRLPGIDIDLVQGNRSCSAAPARSAGSSSACSTKWRRRTGARSISWTQLPSGKRCAKGSRKSSSTRLPTPQSTGPNPKKKPRCGSTASRRESWARRRG